MILLVNQKHTSVIFEVWFLVTLMSWLFSVNQKCDRSSILDDSYELILFSESKSVIAVQFLMILMSWFFSVNQKVWSQFKSWWFLWADSFQWIKKCDRSSNLDDSYELILFSESKSVIAVQFLMILMSWFFSVNQKVWSQFNSWWFLWADSFQWIKKCDRSSNLDDSYELILFSESKSVIAVQFLMILMSWFFSVNQKVWSQFNSWWFLWADSFQWIKKCDRSSILDDSYELIFSESKSVIAVQILMILMSRFFSVNQKVWSPFKSWWFLWAESFQWIKSCSTPCTV